MSLYAHARGHPTEGTDPFGLKVFYTMELDEQRPSTTQPQPSGSTHPAKPEPQRKAQFRRLTFFILLRYSFAPEGTGTALAGKMEEIKDHHIKTIEGAPRKSSMAYYDGNVNWRLKVVMVISTQQAPTIEEHMKRIEAAPGSPAPYREWARYHIQTWGFSQVTVTCQKKDRYNAGLASAFKLPAHWTEKGHTIESLLLEELVLHQMNNFDEINNSTARWGDLFRGAWGRDPEKDSVLGPTPGSTTIYARHWGAALCHVSNTTRKPVDDDDRPILVDEQGTDPCFAGSRQAKPDIPVRPSTGRSWAPRSSPKSRG